MNIKNKKIKKNKKTNFYYFCFVGWRWISWHRHRHGRRWGPEQELEAVLEALRPLPSPLPASLHPPHGSRWGRQEGKWTLSHFKVKDFGTLNLHIVTLIRKGRVFSFLFKLMCSPKFVLRGDFFCHSRIVKSCARLI